VDDIRDVGIDATFQRQYLYTKQDASVLESNGANVKWNDIEYYYVSRLQNEAAPRPDFVVHPGVPRTVRAHFQYFL